MMETNRGVVHPWLCDVMGHMTTRHYTAMFDDASYHLAHACGIVASGGTGFVDVEINMKFLTELKAGSLIYIRSGFLQLGNSSFTSCHRMFNCDDDKLVAYQIMKSVHFDLNKRKSVPLSDEFRAKASSLMTKEPA